MKPRNIMVFLLVMASPLLSVSAWAQAEGRPCSIKPVNMSTAYGDLITCQISADSDDLYYFSGLAGEVIHIYANTGASAVSLMDPFGNTIESAGSGTISRKLQATGKYTIKFTEVTYGNPYYSFGLERITPPSPSMPTLRFGQTIENEINPGGDADYYTFTGYEGDEVTANVSVLTGSDLEFDMYDPAGVLILSGQNWFGPLPVFLLQNGQYTFRVLGGSSSYRMSLQCAGICHEPRASILTPAPGSTLPGSTVTFTWNSAAGAAAYWLDVGSELGVGNYFGAGVGLSTSRTVTNLPLDGSTVYVRLWTKNGGYWFNGDYTYTAAKNTQKQDLLTTSSGNGLRFRDSDTGEWVSLSVPASVIAAGDLDGDGIDDPVGEWPNAGGVWARYSTSGQWVKITSAAPQWLATGDLNGDGKDELVGIWGTTIWSWDPTSSSWAALVSGATQVGAADLDKDGKADLLGIWPDSGVWVKHSSTGLWESLAAPAEWIAAADLNADGKADLIGIWGGSLKYRDTATGSWQTVSAGASQVAAGDMDGDGKGDIVGTWPGDGVWVKYSVSGTWERLCPVPDWIAVGRMR